MNKDWRTDINVTLKKHIRFLVCSGNQGVGAAIAAAQKETQIVLMLMQAATPKGPKAAIAAAQLAMPASMQAFKHAAPAMGPQSPALMTAHNTRRKIKRNLAAILQLYLPCDSPTTER